MRWDDITKVEMGGELNIFKGTGSLDKCAQSIITDEVDKGFTESNNTQVFFWNTWNVLRLSAPVHLARLQRNSKLCKLGFELENNGNTDKYIKNEVNTKKRKDIQKIIACNNRQKSAGTMSRPNGVCRTDMNKMHLF